MVDVGDRHHWMRVATVRDMETIVRLATRSAAHIDALPQGCCDGPETVKTHEWRVLNY